MNWLYAQNAAFWADKTGLPANYDEIIENLRTKHGVSDLPLHRRIIVAIVTFLIALVLIIVLCSLILFTLKRLSTETIGNLLIDFMALGSVTVGAYIFSSTTFDLIAHRQQAVARDWSDLLAKGVLIEGQVIADYYMKWGENKLKYEFFDPGGKRRKAYYFSTAASITVGDTVAVWYVHRKLHTLL